MSRDFEVRAASELGIDVEVYRAAVDTSFEIWADMTGDSRSLNELPPVQAIGRAVCVEGLVLPKVIDEMTDRTLSTEQLDLTPSKNEDPAERRLSEYELKADEFAKANPDSLQNPFDDIVRGIRAGTLSFEN